MMWPDDCYDLKKLRDGAMEAFRTGNFAAGENFLLRLMNACRALDLDASSVSSAADVEVMFNLALDRLNKKWVPNSAEQAG